MVLRQHFILLGTILRRRYIIPIFLTLLHLNLANGIKYNGHTLRNESLGIHSVIDFFQDVCFHCWKTKKVAYSTAFLLKIKRKRYLIYSLSFLPTIDLR